MTPMILDVGNVARIENPSAEQVERYLRLISPQSPFVILSASEERFIQAILCDDGYRVEYREEDRQYFADVPFEQAARLFEAYRVGDTAFKDAAEWRRLTMLNGSHHPAVLIVLIALIICGIAFCVWTSLH
jgi:hypothetical protein